MARQPKIDSKRKPPNKSGENPFMESAGPQGGFSVSPLTYTVMKLLNIGPTWAELSATQKKRVKNMEAKLKKDKKEDNYKKSSSSLGFSKGGYCGASNPPARNIKK